MKRRRHRRTKGTGTLERLPSGRVRATVRIDGVAVRQTFPDEPTARVWLLQQAGSTAGEVGSRPNARLSELRDDYLADLAARGLTESSQRAARWHLDVVLRRWDLRLREVTPPRLAVIVSEMGALGWAPATIHNRVARITALFRFAAERGYIEARPLPVRKPRVTLASRPDTYRAEEVAALVDAASSQPDPRYLAAVLLASRAGLRASEVARVRYCDLDADALLLRVPVRSAADRPKSGVERTIPVPASVAGAVQACPARGEQLVVGRERWRYPSSLWRWLRLVWVAADVEPGRKPLHRLRHTWATALGQAGANTAELMEWGGWASPAMVRRYVHAPAVRRGPVDALEPERTRPDFNASSSPDGAEKSTIDPRSSEIH